MSTWCATQRSSRIWPCSPFPPSSEDSRWACLGTRERSGGTASPPQLHCSPPHIPTGSQPADPCQCPASPLQHPCAHHRAHHDVGHQGGRLRHVSIRAQDSCPCHSQAVQVTGDQLLNSGGTNKGPLLGSQLLGAGRDRQGWGGIWSGRTCPALPSQPRLRPEGPAHRSD